MSEFFERLESNNKERVEEAKKKILDQFGIVKDSWLLNGLYDYYLSTNSAKTIIILVNIREPHYQYLFDRLSESIGKSSKNDHKVQALTLLGHIIRSQPTWLYKLPEHHILKDLLKLLKFEVEILPLISALLVVIVLIPMIPYGIGENLNEIFDIFSRLASWNYTPGRLVTDELVHMQVGLYALFLRLYGMFPCNFLAYLRTQYKDKNRPVFIHTIKPMLESVKMNPSLVTTSKDNETANERWKKMPVHDVIVECERFSLDASDTFCAHDSCQLASGFRSRSGTANSTIESSYFQTLKNLAAAMATNERGEFFTPIKVFNPQTPPIEAYVPQPEFVHDENIVPPAGSSPPEAAIEATPETTPPIQNAESLKMTTSLSSYSTPPPQSPAKKKSPFSFTIEQQQQNFEMLAYKTSPAKKQSPTSPLKIKTTTDLQNSPNSKSFSSRADVEVLLSEKRGEPILKQSDSVLHESEDSTSENMDEDRSSPCAVGGLHMPNSKSMKDFAQRIQRFRHHSQCNTEYDQEITMSCTENGTTVRRANSCPEMKKSPVSSIKDNMSATVDETDEEIHDATANTILNGLGSCRHKTVSNETQTYNFWPMPYEHLFLGIFPSLGVNEVKTSPAPVSPLAQDKVQPSIYEVLDKYIETAVKASDKDNLKLLKNHLNLLHQQLQFERHRREIHAFKNRRFLAEAKTTQVLEEHNSALRDQVQLQQTDIDNLRSQLKILQQEKELEKHNATTIIADLQNQIKLLEHQNKTLLDNDEDMNKELSDLKSDFLSLSVQKQRTESSLVDKDAEVKLAKEQALAGEKGRAELEYAQKQLVLIGDLHLKYKERLEELSSLRRTDQELEMLKECYSNEVKTLRHHLQEKITKLDACTSRIESLEQIVIHKDQIISAQKRTLNSINEEHDEKLKALENKYQTQLTICRSLEEKILELLSQIELSSGKAIRSPDISSCQEVQVPSDRASGGGAGISERSSPLSCSLASSNGSAALSQQGIQVMTDESPGTSKDFDELPTNLKHD